MLEFTFEGEAIADDRQLRVCIQKFHYLNFDEFFSVPLAEVAANKKPVVVSTSTNDILEEYFMAHQQLDRQLDGRLTLI